jgi:hypothetical protein
MSRVELPNLDNRSSILPPCRTMQLSYIVLSGTPVDPVHYGFVYIDIAVSDLEVIPAIRVGAYPGFILYRSPLAAEI